MFWLSRRKQKAVDTPETKEIEYDFLASKESIPAKLDLARTYIDMSDKKAASKVLKEIMKKGDDKQKKEAEALLEQIK